MEEELKKESVEVNEAAEKETTKKEVKNKLKDENKALKADNDKLKDELLRNRAELENFKKHMRDEAIKDRKYASMNLVENIITPLEYLMKACDYQTDDQNMKNFLIGFKMISNQVMDVLVNDGLQEIVTNVGDEFDPNIHHAMEKEAKEGIEANKVIQVLSKGYKYKDRILKPVMVKVSE